MKAGVKAVLASAIAVASGAARAETCVDLGATQYVDNLRYCVSSVLAPQGRNTYGPQNLFDWDRTTAWCEGVSGAGVGETLSVYIEGGGPFRRFFIMNGYQKSEAVFLDNARPRTIEVSTDTGLTFRTTLPDGRQEMMVQMPAVGIYRALHVRIVDVYKGQKYEDTCMTELVPDHEYEEYLMQQADKAASQPQPSVPGQATQPESPSTISPPRLEDLPGLPDL